MARIGVDKIYQKTMPFSNKLHHWFLVSVIEIDPFASGKKEGTPGFEPGTC